MKHTIGLLAFILLILTVLPNSADQAASLDAASRDKAINYLKNAVKISNKYYEYCRPCGETVATEGKLGTIKSSNQLDKKTKDEKPFRINLGSAEADLAYIYVAGGTKNSIVWVNLAKAIGLTVYDVQDTLPSSVIPGK